VVALGAVFSFVPCSCFADPADGAQDIVPRELRDAGNAPRSFEVAQWPWFSQPEPEPTPRPRRTARPETPPGGEFVAAPDLADQLKKIDPGATVEWDSRRLRITIREQKFTLFPSTREMVVNGTPERVSAPLRIYRDEIYVPQDAIERIGKRLEEVVPVSTPEAGPTTTPLATATPTAMPAVTPAPTPLPTPSPTPAVTPVQTPSVTLVQTPASTPTATPVLMPTPTPEPTPVLTSPPSTPQVEILTTPSPKKTPRDDRAQTPAPVAGVDLFQQALRDRAAFAGHKIRSLTTSDLQALAAEKGLTKVVLDPGDANDAGSVSGREAFAISLEIARKVKARLELKGITAELTRYDSQRVSPARMLETVTNSGAQVLLSIRAGVSPSPEMAGYRILHVNESVDHNALRAPAKEINDALPLDQNYKPFQERSRILGSAMLAGLKAVTERDAVGMVPAPLFLAKRAPMASVLVVAGYITNPGDRARLVDQAKQDELADALTEALVQYGAQLPELPRPSVAGERAGVR
jgi:N-acetylmuramoyl-L-alanine amidase